MHGFHHGRLHPVVRMPSAPSVSVLEECSDSDPPPSYQEACAQRDLDNLEGRHQVFENTQSSKHGHSHKHTSTRRSLFSHRTRIEDVDGPTDNHNYSTNNQTFPEPLPRKSKNTSKSQHQRIEITPIVTAQTLSPLEAGLIPKIRIEEIYAALRFYYQNKLFKSDKINQYVVTNVETFCIWTYHLKTIHEYRRMLRVRRPYSGSVNANKQDMVHVSEWDLDIPEQRGSGSKQFKVPRSSTVTSCDSCSGEGSNPCSRCRGDGEVPCECCGGSGHQFINEAVRKRETCHQQRVETCNECHGATITRCHMCHGNLRRSCQNCNRTGKVETHLQLLLEWETKQSTHYADTNFTNSFLKRCKDIRVYENTSKIGPIQPLTTQECSHKKLICASKNFTKSHNPTSVDYVIRKQAHTISLIPMYKVTCHKSSKKKTYWLAGTNHNIFHEPSPFQFGLKLY